MRVRRSWRIFPLTLVVALSIPKRADACCGMRDPESEAAEAHEVFQGRLLGYSQAPQNRIPELARRIIARATPRPLRGALDRIEPKCRLEFDVTRVFKGKGAPTRTVRMEGDCAGLPPPGDEWIVFGTREGFWLDVGYCTASGPVGDPWRTEFLGPGRPADPPAPFGWVLAVMVVVATSLGFGTIRLARRRAQL